MLEQEFAPSRPLDALIRPLLRFEVDPDARTVTCRLGVGNATAAYTEGLGCALVQAPVDPDRRRYARPLPRFRVDAPAPAELWPRGARASQPGPKVDAAGKHKGDRRRDKSYHGGNAGDLHRFASAAARL